MEIGIIFGVLLFASGAILGMHFGYGKGKIK
jgi:hypothetical protein